MSLQYYVSDNLLSFVFEAGTETEEIYAAVHKAYQDPACPPDAHILFDLQASTSIASRSFEGIRTLSQFMLEHPGRPGRRIGIVLDPSEVERMAPMATSFVEQTGLDIRIFEDLEDARSWLEGT